MTLVLLGGTLSLKHSITCAITIPELSHTRFDTYYGGLTFTANAPANHYNLVRKTFSPACLLSPYPYLDVKDTGNGNFISGPNF